MGSVRFDGRRLDEAGLDHETEDLAPRAALGAGPPTPERAAGGSRETAKKQGRAVSDYVFPGLGVKGHRIELKKDWRELCIAAGIVELGTVELARGKERTIVTPSARIHDLRHTYASVLASAGLSLPIIGALLGHSQPATTARYSHLLDDPLRAATERVGAIVMPKGEGAETQPLKGDA